MVSLSSKESTFFRVVWVGAVFNILKKKRLVTFHLIFSSFLPSTFYLLPSVVSDSSSQISASDWGKLCRSASFGSTRLTPVVFTICGFPRIRFLLNFILLWILGIRYRLCTGNLNSDRGDAARSQKLPTTIKRQYNSILPKQERIKGTEKASPYTPYSIGNSSRVIFKTTDPKGG